jgi:hypothetical protein
LQVESQFALLHSEINALKSQILEINPQSPIAPAAVIKMISTTGNVSQVLVMSVRGKCE